MACAAAIHGSDELKPHVLARILPTGTRRAVGTRPRTLRAVQTEAERGIVVPRADRPAAALAGSVGRAALTDLTQFGNAHTKRSPAVNFNLWRGV